MINNSRIMPMLRTPSIGVKSENDPEDSEVGELEEVWVVVAEVWDVVVDEGVFMITSDVVNSYSYVVSLSLTLVIANLISAST